jgi:hypothetical protein
MVHSSDRQESGSGNDADVITEMSIEAVVSIFSAYGLSLEVAMRAQPGATSIVALGMEAGVGAFGLGAQVTFAGRDVRGALLLASNADVIAPTRPCAPKRFAALPPAARLIMTQDWMGELANQVLGRVKANLAGFGVSFDTHAPVPLSSDALARVVPKSADTRPILFRSATADKTVGFWFDFLHSGKLVTGAPAPSGSANRVILF